MIACGDGDSEPTPALEGVAGDCRAWLRDGEAWTGVDQVSATPTSVTVPISQTTTIGAGVFLPSFAISCTSCKPPVTPTTTCVDGNKFCIEKIGKQHTPDRVGYTSYKQGTLFWVPPKTSNSLVLSSFDLFSREALSDSGVLSNVTTPDPVGEVTIDKSGARWLGLGHFGNVRFTGTSIPTRFDFSTTTKAVGVVLNRQNSEAMRVRGTFSGGRNVLTGVQLGTTYQLGTSTAARHRVGCRNGRRQQRCYLARQSKSSPDRSGGFGR